MQLQGRTRHLGAIQTMFFLSGAGALVLENVWFNQLGLVVGNSVWAAALVVGAFMAGLALGNGMAIALARRWNNLLRGYGMLEVAAAASGAALVVAFPFLPAAFQPLLAPFLDDAALLNTVRLALAFMLMMVPASALGATLPLLTKPLEAASGNYGFALGRLYAVNTLGAVAGTLAAELVLVPAIGLRGSGLVAAGCSLSAAFIALRIAKHPMFEGPRSDSALMVPLDSPEGRRIAAAAFLAGGILLALEVVWFRFLLVFVLGTSLVFAVMLAVVLAGIGLGAWLASTWSQAGWSSDRVARTAAMAGAAGTVAGFAGFDPILNYALSIHQADSMLPVIVLVVFLMGPVSLASGVLFTALGDQMRARMTDAAASTGLLTFANTTGAVSGSLLAAFALVPASGLERSFLILALLYAVTAGVVPVPRAGRWRRLAPMFLAAALVALFPFGMMADTYHRHVERRFDARLVASREGVVETAFYLRHEFLGEPLHYRLATNAYSMSANSIASLRYMKLFAYLPAAFHPGIERALLICFGVGGTASALADLPGVRAIDVVDVSRDILEMSDLVYPEARDHPLRDPRVSVHVEDGRFFLQQTTRRYDLITGEPPPPWSAGMASLYSREFFQLVRARLNPGGLATYWLPVRDLHERDALALIRAFCEVFADCSLWSGLELDWILMGSREGIAPVSRESFSRLWALPRPGRELRRIGIGTPEQLVGQFMADAAVLRQLAIGTRPLVDDFPRRIDSGTPTRRAGPLYAGLMDAGGSRERLERSDWIAAILPRSLVAGSGERFRQRMALDAAAHPELRRPGASVWSDLAALILHSDLVEAPRWILRSEMRKVEIAMSRDSSDPLAAEHLAIDHLAQRRPPGPAMRRARFEALTPGTQVVTMFRHCLAGQDALAIAYMGWIAEDRRLQEPYRSFFSWAAANCRAPG